MVNDRDANQSGLANQLGSIWKTPTVRHAPPKKLLRSVTIAVLHSEEAYNAKEQNATKYPTNVSTFSALSSSDCIGI